MTQKLYVRRGGGAASETEVMDMVTTRKGAPVFEGQTPLIDIGRRAADGEASQGTFRLMDPAAEIHSTTYRLSPHALVTWTEDASGDELWLARSRIAPLESGRRAINIGGDEIEWDVTVNDNNMDLRGQAFTENVDRPAETDIERIMWLHDYTLNGSSSTASHRRSSSNITVELDTDGHLVSSAFDRNMPARTYPAGTQPQDVIAECAERSGKTYAVVIHHTGGTSHDCLLYVGALDHATYVTDVKVSDQLADIDIDSPTAPVFPPIWDRGKGTLTENDDVVSGVVVIYGGTTDAPLSTFVHDPADEAPYEYWVEAINDDKVDDATEAANLADTYFTSHRAPGHRTHRFSIKMHASQHALINAGMSIQVKSAVIAGGADLGTYVWRRITELRWEPDPDPEWLWAHIDLEKVLRRRGHSFQPSATSPKPAPQTQPDTPGTLVVEWDFESHGAPTDTYDTTGTYDSNLQLVAPGSSNLPDPSSAGGWTTASHRATDAIPVTAGTSYTFKTDIKWHFDPGIRDVYINYDGGSSNQQMLVDGSGGYGQHTTYTVTKTFTVPTGKTSLAIWFSPYSGIVVDNMSLSTVGTPADNDPNSLPDPGTSPYYARSDDPRFTADDQHLITRLSERVVNNSGGDLNAGDVVIPDTSYDGHGVTTTTTASTTAARVGVLLEDIADGETGVVLWEGVITNVNDGASTSADGDYLYTSTTAGAAAVSGSRTTGAVGRVVRDDSGDPVYILWWGVPDAGGGSSGHTIKEDGTPLTARAGLNFGSGIVATDDSGNNETDVDLDWAEDADVSTQAFGDSPATGTSQEVARAGHKHGMPANPLVGSVSTLNYVISNGNQTLATGIAGDVVIDFACTITGVTLLADQSGSVVVDIWKDTYTNYPPTNADSLIDTGAGGTKPTISSATKSQDTTLAHWTTSISAGDTLRFNVDSATTIRRVAVALKLTRT